ncbi:MAG TPA: hypothetical protein VGK47_03700 [Nitrososphaeraceae archaeon]
MNKKNEFLTKLATLLEEYKADMYADHVLGRKGDEYYINITGRNQEFFFDVYLPRYIDQDTLLKFIENEQNKDS